MSRAWYLRDKVENRYEENQTDPARFLTEEQLYLETEVILGRIDVDPLNDEKSLQNAQKVRNMTNKILVGVDIAKDGSNFDENCDKFYHEHIHVGEVMRIVIEGRGWLDVLDLNGKWIRSRLQTGDYYIIPSGCYHRVTADMSKKLKAYMMQYDAAAAAQYFWPEGDQQPAYIQYVERMRCLRRSLKFPYSSQPTSVDVTQ